MAEALVAAGRDDVDVDAPGDACGRGTNIANQSNGKQTAGLKGDSARRTSSQQRRASSQQRRVREDRTVRLENVYHGALHGADKRDNERESARTVG